MTKFNIPLLPLRASHVFPTTTVPFRVGRPRSLQLLSTIVHDAEHEHEHEHEHDTIVVARQKDPDVDEPKQEDLYEIGVVCKVVKIIEEGSSFKLKGPTNVVVEGLYKVKILSVEGSGPYDMATVEALPFEEDVSGCVDTFSLLKDLLSSYLEEDLNAPRELINEIVSARWPAELAYHCAANLNLDDESQYAILKSDSVSDVVLLTINWLKAQTTRRDLQAKVKKRVAEETEKAQKEWWVKQQIKVLHEEIGSPASDLDALRERFEDPKVPDDVRTQGQKQLARLQSLNPSSAEYNVALTYVETLLDIPWGITTEDTLDITKAREILDKDHHGLQKIKTRILEHLAVCQLKKDLKGPILCLSGSPGTGKTSIAKSVARALNREFVRVSLGGVHDESEIRGHRRTYVGAMPGRIAKALTKAGTMNPVILLDEIDKIGKDRGNPQAAMLEALDPEQNNTFSDHYIETPLNLSRVLFIATANYLDQISGPLRDRMEIIEVPSYTTEEKTEILKNYLIPKQVEAHGINLDHLKFEDDAITYMIRHYTREAGVREVERKVTQICRSVAMRVAGMVPKERASVRVTVDIPYVEKVLGIHKYLPEKMLEVDSSGVATGMAWTPMGGLILFVEVVMTPGSGQLKLTGQLGDVMQESAEASMTLLKSRAASFGIPMEVFKEKDFHVHFPSGAVPKDGPSAGVTIFTALLSKISGIKVKAGLAMTGEVTLRGSILPVGGIREKLTAAHRAGIREVIIPKSCEKDLADLHPTVSEDLDIHLVRTIEDLAGLALEGDLKPLGPELTKLPLPLNTTNPTEPTPEN